MLAQPGVAGTIGTLTTATTATARPAVTAPARVTFLAAVTGTADDVDDQIVSGAFAHTLAPAVRRSPVGLGSAALQQVRPRSGRRCRAPPIDLGQAGPSVRVCPSQLKGACRHRYTTALCAALDLRASGPSGFRRTIAERRLKVSIHG